MNEAIDDDGTLRRTIWLDTIGPDYLELAFQFANEADPSAKLFYNDYGAEIQNPKSDAIYALLGVLKQKNVPVHGVGFQMHISTGSTWTASSIADNFRRFAALGLETNITEMDMVIDEQTGTIKERLQKQADVYCRILCGLLELPSVRKLTFWGFTDRHSWRSTDKAQQTYPLIFDREYNRKPAYDAVAAALASSCNN